jgi:hypothetical protein
MVSINAYRDFVRKPLGNWHLKEEVEEQNRNESWEKRL